MAQAIISHKQYTLEIQSAFNQGNRALGFELIQKRAALRIQRSYR